MGARGIDPRRRSAPLSVEPLEDRLLLSGAGTLVVDPISALSAHSPVAIQQNSQSRVPVPNDSTIQGSRAGPSSSVADAAGLPAAVPQHPASAAARENEPGQVFYPVTLLHPPIGPTTYQPFPLWRGQETAPQREGTYQPDGDNDFPTEGMEEAHPHYNQALLPPYSFTNEDSGGANYGAPSVSPEQLPAHNGGPHLLLNLLSAAGFGLAATPVAAAASPFAASRYAGKDQGESTGGEGGKTMPAVPQSSPLLLPQPASEPDSPPLESSPGGPFADLLPIDLAAIERSADAFFQQLAHFSEEWHDSRVIEKLTPWFVAASLVAFSWLRLRRKQSFSAPAFEDSWEPGPAVFLTGEEE
jgi:hypothetical protein